MEKAAEQQVDSPSASLFVPASPFPSQRISCLILSLTILRLGSISVTNTRCRRPCWLRNAVDNSPNCVAARTWSIRVNCLRLKWVEPLKISSLEPQTLVFFAWIEPDKDGT